MRTLRRLTRRVRIHCAPFPGRNGLWPGYPQNAPGRRVSGEGQRARVDPAIPEPHPPEGGGQGSWPPKPMA